MTTETDIELAVHECEQCRQSFEECEINTCADCESVLICDDCSRENDSGKRICEKCAEDYYTCECCDTVIRGEDSVYADDRIWCQSCYDENYSTCDDCGESCSNDSANRDSRGTCVCQSCYENGWITCEDCDRLCTHDDSHYCESCEQCVCNSCSDRNHDHDESIDLDSHARDLVYQGSDAITDYHPTVEWEFKKSKTDLNTDPFFGVELEIETGDSTSKACKVVGNLLAGRCIASHDGSLSDGFEIVHTPHKYQAFRELNFSKVLKELSKVGATSHEKGTCGLHVHLERIPFLNKQLSHKEYLLLSKRSDCYRMYSTKADLFQYMFNQLEHYVLPFSQRNRDKLNYCKFNYGSDRYSAVNLQNDKTIEIRLWRGTLEPSRFKASIQMSLALLDFMQVTSSVTIFGGSFKLKEAFKAFLERSGKYQLLVNYLKLKQQFGFSPRTKKRPVLKLSNRVPTEPTITVF